MANINLVPERTINYRVYKKGGIGAIGIATVDLPEIETMSDTTSGAGIAGEFESGTLGHFTSMTLTLNWRTITGDAMELSEPTVQHLELRSSQQINDLASSQIKTQAVRIVVRCTPKKISLGSLEVSATTDSSSEFEVLYLKMFIDNREVLEIDKLNFIYKVRGKNYLQTVAQDLGI